VDYQRTVTHDLVHGAPRCTTAAKILQSVTITLTIGSRVHAFAEGGAGGHEGRGVERVELNVRVSVFHEGCGAGKKGPPGVT
jgi:hypothetical protein